MSTRPNQVAAMDLHDDCVRRLLGCVLAARAEQSLKRRTGWLRHI